MRKTIFLFCFLFSVSAFGQNDKFTVVYQIGLGAYNMSDLKSFIVDYAKSLPFDAKLVNSYPAFAYHQFSVLQRLGKSVHLGINYRFCSTGARLSYADYSGKYSMDNLLSLNAIGLSTVIDIIDKGTFKSSISFSLSSNKSKIRFHEYATLHGVDYNYNDKDFKSSSNCIEIGVEAKKVVFGRAFVGLNAGYSYSTKGVIYTNDNNYYLVVNGKKVNTNWSGYKVGLMIGVLL